MARSGKPGSRRRGFAPVGPRRGIPSDGAGSAGGKTVKAVVPPEACIVGRSTPREGIRIGLIGSKSTTKTSRPGRRRDMANPRQPAITTSVAVRAAVSERREPAAMPGSHDRRGLLRA